jgi:hypothetical protein
MAAGLLDMCECPIHPDLGTKNCANVVSALSVSASAVCLKKWWVPLWVKGGWKGGLSPTDAPPSIAEGLCPARTIGSLTQLPDQPER